MNFDLSDEQRLLRESVSRLMADRCSFEERRSHAAAEGGFSAEIWQAYAELGLTALPFSEEDGGIGGGAEEVMIVMEELGRALALEPFLASVVIPASLLRQLATPAERAGLAEAIIEGSMRPVFAHGEANAGYRLEHVGTSAKAGQGGYVLDGAKTLVVHGGSATHLIVSARLSGSVADKQGIGLFLVEADTAGLSRREYPTQDGMRAAEITLSGVRVDGSALIGGSEDSLPAITAACDEAIAALCAEAVGAMDAALETTVEYLKTRKQFGRAIGDFQALQHKASEMVVELEQARSMAIFAAMMSRHADPVERARSISAAKIQVSRSAKMMGQASIQLHGGVGMTMEYKIGHYFKRLAMIEKAFGDVDFHLDRLGDLGGLVAA